ncbi:bifunctional helix-turn-helix transcriptional regulator/GNAT family N-acetyltransferase [Actinopolymorpha alba]|uniref:bifunctional helix-turn-helix transcriptional regulator/GNAT family N-acetyltransferase n=1 Tax=Actinopolymorpha alba TaxID=533267 RepID=UPI00039AB2FA|nr:helix-turn-helix domain-containing GNAT family N-acetyltransferase [Actinopolymorpha alba]
MHPTSRPKTRPDQAANSSTGAAATAAPDVADPTAEVRAFNRFYTAQIGALGEGHLRTGYSLTEARVLFELAHHPACEVTSLRGHLGLDASYLSRILARFEGDGLLERQRSPIDARRQVVTLTKQGQQEFGLLNDRASDDIHTLLGGLSEEDQGRLVSAMRLIRGILEDAPRAPAFVLRPLRPGDLGWVVHRNAVVYTEEYGWDETYEALVARIIADYIDHHDPVRESGWVAEVNGDRAGAVLCVRKDDEVAQLRLLLVEPSVRGLGIGSRLVEECIRFARRSGYRQMVLWTNDVLADARRIYERAGFTLEKVEPHHSFGHDLVGQWWRLDLI